MCHDTAHASDVAVASSSEVSINCSLLLCQDTITNVLRALRRTRLTRAQNTPLIPTSFLYKESVFMGAFVSRSQMLDFSTLN